MTAGYGNLQILHDVTITVGRGEVVALLGANGAGKTTTLRALSGLIRHGGTIAIAGHQVSRDQPEHRVRRGLALVPEGRGTFANLSVVDNLHVGGLTRPRREVLADVEHWFGYFPRLADRRDQLAGTLSGGEQQMLAVSRALMSRPTLLLLDEPSMGLAPNITSALFDRLGQITRDQDIAMLIVEQNANLALSIASRGYVLESGQLTVEGDAASLLTDERIRRAYLQV